MSEAAEQTEGTESLTDKVEESGSPKPEGDEGGAQENESEAGGEGGESAPAAAEKVIPEKYDFKLPEGSIIDEKHFEAVSAYAKEHKLSQEEAQAVLERDAAVIGSYDAAQKERYAKEAETWVSKVKSDPEIGGENFKESVATAQRMVDKFFSPEFKEQLDKTGLGNHPELVRGLYRMGKLTREDKAVLAGKSSTEEKSIEELLYPSHFKKES